MDLEFKKWFIAERARALAIVLLTRRDDLVIKDKKEETGLDYTVWVQGNKRQGERPFALAVAGDMTPITIETANNRVEPVLKRVRACKPFHYPVCVFYFTVKDDQGYYAWAAEPIVTPEGLPRLKAHSEPHCGKLDNDALDRIVVAVNQWYDAFDQAITA